MRILSFFNRFFWLIAAAGISTAFAQQTVSFKVSTTIPGASFTVDGTLYTSAAQFEWPEGSQHIVSYFQSQLPANVILPSSTSSTFPPLQLSQDGTEIYLFAGWEDNTGFLSPTRDATQVVTANGSITSLTATLTLSYRVLLSFQADGATVAAPACGAPGSAPPNTLQVGYVYINGDCYWSSAILYFPAASNLTLNAFPLPGFVFLGWSSNLGSNNANLRSYVLNGPVEISPSFEPGKRVRVETNPLGLNVLIDRSQSPTLAFDNGGTSCNGDNLPIPVATNDPPLCFGDFDFAPGSSHLIAAVSPQKDVNGNTWVFDSWTSKSGQSGQTQNSVYVTDNQTADSDKITVKFDPGVQASFLTVPAGLQLTIDGRSNWPGYNFVWGLGSTHQIAAPAQQADSTGRQYTLAGWSNGGSASQTVTMVSSTVTSGFRMVANYNELSRLVVQTVPAGQTVQIDGAACVTPCNVDRANGAQVHVTAATSIAIAAGTKLDFASWSDGGAADHMYTIASNLQTLTANYNTLYQLAASGSPANGVSFAFNPTSSDGYYPANSNVTVTAKALNGFKFLRWGGDLNGTYPSGTLSMGGPHAVVAQLGTVPYIAPIGVENGAGPTPDAVVAAGSIAMILGESLAPSTVVGPVNPLAQTIDNVIVTLGNQLLPLFSVTPQQITVLLPSSLSPGNYTLQVQSPGEPAVSADFTIVRDAPGIFTNPSNSKAYILGLHKDGTLVTAAKPAAQGEQITFFGTGFGPYSSPVIDGFYPPTPAPKTVDPVTILAAGEKFQPDWAGAAAGYTGLVAVKFTITNAMPTGTDVNLQVEINGRLSNTVVLPMQ